MASYIFRVILIKLIYSYSRMHYLQTVSGDDTHSFIVVGHSIFLCYRIFIF